MSPPIKILVNGESSASSNPLPASLALPLSSPFLAFSFFSFSFSSFVLALCLKVSRYEPSRTPSPSLSLNFLSLTSKRLSKMILIASNLSTVAACA